MVDIDKRRWLTRHWITDRVDQATRVPLSAGRRFISSRSPAESTEPKA